tara:strand:+ start:2344 stop:2718 length:375 start_codon:yes stop_codon:yes gene_type:complete
MIQNKCNCDCHKKNAESDLKKCQEQNKKKTREIGELRQKLMMATIAIAIVGTLVSKQAFDFCIEYFEKYDKVKQAIDNSISMTDEQLKHNSDDSIGYWGVSVLPSPSALAVFALPLLTPTPRRR